MGGRREDLDLKKGLWRAGLMMVDEWYTLWRHLQEAFPSLETVNTTEAKYETQTRRA